MEPKESQTDKQVSLRVILPNLYNYMTAELESRFNLHPYDFQVSAMKEVGGYNIIIQFGDGFAHNHTEFFSYETIQKTDSEIDKVIEKIGESCKEVMIADYFKMMKM